MLAPLQHRSFSFQPTLKRDLLQRTAGPILVFRVAEGLGAWLLFTRTAFEQSLLRYGVAAWFVHALFLAYFGVNLLCYSRYRADRASDRLLWADLVVNLGTMLLVSGHTGGLASPVVLICLIKITAYGFVFSPIIGVCAIVLTIGVVGLFGAGAGILGLNWLPGDPALQSAEPAATLLFRFLLVTGTLIASTWLFNQVAETERKTAVETNRARRFADREHAAAATTTALLSVSEAVSRLTHLDEVLNKVVDIAPRMLDVDYCAFFLWDDERSLYSGAAVSGLEPTAAHDLLSLRLQPEEVPDLEWVRRLGHCAVIGPREAERIGVTGALALLTAPLLSGGRFYGALLFARRNGRSFNQSDLRLADGIAGQAAVAIERARLVEESHRLVRAVESTDEAVLITDRHRRIVFANPAFVRMLGYTWEELAGRDSLTLGGQLTDYWLTEVQRDVLDRAWRGEALAQRKDGTTVPVALNASIIRAADNSIEGAVAILEDITVKKQMQEKLARADRLAAAGELAAGVAHEVNNALVGILGQADLAHTATDADSLRAALGRVEIQGRRIADIVQDLLGFARPQTPQRVAVDLNQLVNDTLALMAHDLARHGIRTETLLPPDLPAIFADDQQIQQVLVNLFTNAMQALEPGGGGVLTVTLRPMKDVVNIEVHDNGPGIPADVLPRVFDPFVSTKPKGTGLGLSVSYAIARAHGGDLTVHSTPSEGTTFTLQLPAVVAVDTPTPMSVLLVDDDNDVAATLRDMLVRMNVTVHRVATGTEALATLATDNFDAIFLDVRLPDISGPEIYARLAAERPDLARRVAFITGGLWRSDNRTLREQLPPQPTLSKPCTAAQIREVLRLLRVLSGAAKMAQL